MKVRVFRPYKQPYLDPISVRAGDRVFPDFDRETDIPGWVWCTAEDGRGGWAPRAWLQQEGPVWRIDRDFNAIELTITPGERLEILEEESGFYRAVKSGGETGWVPVECVTGE
jgi:hypothetical protein